MGTVGSEQGLVQSSNGLCQVCHSTWSLAFPDLRASVSTVTNCGELLLPETQITLEFVRNYKVPRKRALPHGHPSKHRCVHLPIPPRIGNQMERAGANFLKMMSECSEKGTSSDWRQADIFLLIEEARAAARAFSRGPLKAVNCWLVNSWWEMMMTGEEADQRGRWHRANGTSWATGDQASAGIPRKAAQAALAPYQQMSRGSLAQQTSLQSGKLDFFYFKFTRWNF